MIEYILLTADFVAIRRKGKHSKTYHPAYYSRRRLADATNRLVIGEIVLCRDGWAWYSPQWCFRDERAES